MANKTVMVSLRMSNLLRFMADNTLAVVTPFMSLFTSSEDSLLAFLNIDCVHNFFASLLWDLAAVFMRMLLALHLLLVLTMMIVSWLSGSLMITTISSITTMSIGG